MLLVLYLVLSQYLDSVTGNWVLTLIATEAVVCANEMETVMTVIMAPVGRLSTNHTTFKSIWRIID